MMVSILRTGATFLILADGPHRAIVCDLCGSVSTLPGDVEYRYCGRCHLFHDIVAAVRGLVAEGGTHECSEWPTGGGGACCAICQRPL